MPAVYIDGTEVEVLQPTLARRVQDMAKGVGKWEKVAKAALAEFVAPLHILSFAALERTSLDEPFKTVLSHELPLLRVGQVGPRATMASFVEAAATPGQVFVTEDVAGQGALACAALAGPSGPMHLFVLRGRVPSVSNQLLAQFANQLLDLLRPAAGGAAARAPADAVSIAIRRAKREWETVADGLPAIVGLADAAGRVMRVNRSWTRVPGAALGRSIHSLLHDGCTAPDCAFAKRLSVALNLIPRHQKLIVNVREDERGTAWSIHLRYQAARAGRGARVVFSISEISEAERALRQLRSDKKAPDVPVQELAPAAGEARAPVAGSPQELGRLLERHDELLDEARRQFAEKLRLSLGQSLAAAQLGIESAMEVLRREGKTAVLEDLGRSLALMRAATQEAIAPESRQLPSGLQESGLAKALRSLCAAWLKSPNAKEASVSCAVADRNVPQHLWVPIYRLVQEALQDLGRYAGSRTLGITLVPGDSGLLLAIESSGLGLAEEQVGTSSGMLLMRELAEFSGGAFRIDAVPGGGAAIEVLWSLAAEVSRGAAPSAH